MSLRLRQLSPEQASDVARRAALAFGASDDRQAALQRIQRQLDGGQYWGLEDDGRLYAQCRLTTAEHWFGGRRVRCQHVASVAVAPEDRRRGLGRRLMREVIAQGAEDGCGLSLLFPATTAPYRALGYEHAGTFTRYRLRARRAPTLDSPMRPAAPERDWPGIQACHERAASRLAGPEARGEERWAALRRSAFVYVLDGGTPGSVDAYALFDHTREPGDWRYILAIRDWAALTPAGLTAVIGLVAVHGSFGKAATFRGPTPEPWSLFVAEQDIRTASAMFWMARGLDLPAAVGARGFPSTVTMTATFTVDDPLLPAARGPWRLEIADGHGLLSPSPDADLRLNARAVGPLFTGMYPPAQLALAGLVTGPADAVSTLAGAFAGPLPVLLDFF